MGHPWPSGPAPTGPSGPNGPGRADDPDRLLTPSEVAAAFGVHPMTVWKWAQRGRIGCVRTVGGHRRYYETGGELEAVVTLPRRAVRRFLRQTRRLVPYGRERLDGLDRELAEQLGGAS